MKRLIPITLFLALTNVMNAQSFLIETFDLEATGKTYGIYTDIDGNKSSSYSLYYDMQAPNDEQEVQSKMSFYHNPSAYYSSIDVFKDNIKKAKTIYSKWKSIAQSNSLKLISKKIPVRVSDQNLYFTENGKWFWERGVDMWFTFYVNQEGACFLILESDYMTSDEVVSHSSSIGVSFTGYFSKNPLMGVGTSRSTLTVERYCSGASLTFSSEEEIDNFLQKIDNVIEWKRMNVENGQLLK